MSSSNRPGGGPRSGRGSLAVGLVLVAALAVAVAAVAWTSPPKAPVARPTPSSAESPCTDRSGVCLPPDVCPPRTHRYASEELERLRPEVESMVEGAFYGVGTGLDTIDVELFPGHEQLAAELEQRFGDAVTIRIGTTRYCGGPGRSGRCADVQGATTLPRGLHLALTLERRTVFRSERAAAGSLRVVYDGPGSFVLELGQPIVAQLVSPGTRRVVGTFTGGIAGTGLSVHLTAGKEQSIDVLVGIARCDGEIGSAISPGTYAVRAPLGPDGGPSEYLAPEVPLTIR